MIRGKGLKNEGIYGITFDEKEHPEIVGNSSILYNNCLIEESSEGRPDILRYVFNEMGKLGTINCKNSYCE